MSLDWRWCVLVTNPSEQSSSDQTPSAPPLQEIISSQESATEAIAKVDAFLNDLKRNKASLLQRLESVRKQNEALQDELSRQTAALQQETSARSSQETRIRQLQQQIASLERKLEATGKARQNWQAVADAHPLESANAEEWLRYGTALLQTLTPGADQARQQQQAALAFLQARNHGAGDEAIRAAQRESLLISLREAMVLCGLDEAADRL
jgi:chromosome segregation ATPase